MPRIRYGVSPWQDRVPKSSRPVFPRYRGTSAVPIAIVGGGLTGMVTAYVFGAAGIRTVVLESEEIGLGGGTGRGAGLLLADPAGSFLTHENAFGRRAARALWQTTHRAALDFAATLRRLTIRCGLDATDRVLYVRHGDQVRGLQREAQGRREAGVDATWLNARALGALRIEGAAGIRSRGHARLDPYRACIGFARAAVARGATIFERSPVRRILARSKHVDVLTAGGSLQCEQVVLATAEPSTGFGALDRHFVVGETYMVQTPPLGVALRKAAPPASTIVQDDQDPPHYLTWADGDRVLWGGADQSRVPPRLRDRVLVQRGGQLMYELSLAVPAISGLQPEFVWDAPSTRTLDGLPFIGPHRNYPRHLFALGLGASLTGAFLAARVLLRRYEGRPEKVDEHFGFSRLAR
jgi:glycine/D-amino acid oxidase-like deaminating enzyme